MFLSFSLNCSMRSGYFHFGNNHIFIQLTFFKYVFQMFVYSRNSNIKKLCHSLLSEPDSLIMDDSIDRYILFHTVINQEIKSFFICHVYPSISAMILSISSLSTCSLATISLISALSLTISITSLLSSFST